MTENSEILAEKPMDELRQLAEPLGIPVPVGTSKVDLAAQIVAAREKEAAAEAAADESASPEEDTSDAVPSEAEPASEDAGDTPAELPVDEGEQPEAAAEPEPEPTPDDPEVVEHDGYEEHRKPITEIDRHGNWTDPFSGLRVYHSTDVCVQSGAHRDGDEAVLRVPKVEDA